MDGNMKICVVAMATILLGWSSVAVESSPISNDLKFFIDDPTAETYSKFLNDLRVQLTCYTLDKYHLIVQCTESDLEGQRYLMVVLSYDGALMTLAIDVVNLDLVAYESGTNSYFFANTGDLKDQLFEGTEQVTMEFSNSYKSLGDHAVVDLGISVLQTAFHALTNYNSSETSTIKKNLIMVIGMVSEAARLKLIENAVTEDFNTNFKPNSKIISYEDKWGDLSKNIQRATNDVFPDILHFAFYIILHLIV